MFKLKRIVIVFMLLSIFMSSFTFAENENKEDTNTIENINEYEILKILNVMDTNNDVVVDPKHLVTRGEFAKYLSKISNAYGDGLTTSYEDITNNNHKIYIQALIAMKVMGGYSDNTFRPDDPITYQDALTAAIRLLGYDVYADNKGGYPSGYVNVANSEGITKGLTLKTGDNITVDEMVVLIVNVLKTDILRQDIFGDEIKYDKLENVNFLSLTYDVYEASGIVKENEYTTLTNTATSVSKGYVKIDKTNYKTEQTNISEYIGHNVSYYYKKEDSGDIGKIIYFYIDSKYSKSIRVSNENIVSVADNKFTYIKSNRDDKELYIKFSGDINVIYNGKAYPYYTNEDLKPKKGEVTFIDNNSDNKYDVINIKSYENYVVDLASETNSQIYFKNNNFVLDFKPTGKSIEYTLIKNSKSIEINEISQWNVLSIAKSKDETLYNIVVSDFYIEGEITQVISDDVTKVVVEDEVYEICSDYAYVPKVGESGKFIIDFMGNIVARTTVGALDEQYGYIIRIHQKKGPNSEMTAKILTVDGIETKKFKEKINFIETSLSSNAGDYPVVTKENTHFIYAAKLLDDPVYKEKFFANGVVNQGSKTEQQLVKFRQNKLGEIIQIKTYVDLSAIPHRKEETTDNFTYNYKMNNDGLYYRGGSARIFGARYRVNAKTVIFKVPEDYSTDETKYAAYNISLLTNDRQYKNMEFYDVSNETIIGNILYRSSSGTATNIIYYDPVTVVKEVVECYENDKSTYKLYGYLNGLPVEYAAKEADLADNDSEWGNGIKLKDLKMGDIIQLSINSQKCIDEMRVIYQHSDNKPYFENVSGGNAGLNYIHGGIYSAYGEVIGRYTNSLVFNAKLQSLPAAQQFQWDRTFGVDTNLAVFKVDSAKKQIRKVSINEIENGQKVFLQGSYSVLQNVVIYE